MTHSTSRTTANSRLAAVRSVPGILHHETSVGNGRGTRVSALMADYDRSNLRLNNIDWPVLGFMVLVHAGLLAAPFFFTWQALGRGGPVSLADLQHRHLPGLSPVFGSSVLQDGAGRRNGHDVLWCDCLGEGTPLTWAATAPSASCPFRSAGRSSFSAGWKMVVTPAVDFCPPRSKSTWRRCTAITSRIWPRIRFCGCMSGRMPCGCSAWPASSTRFGGWPLLLWGVCVRMFFAYHSTWFVNSATHLWGYRNYETTDESRNLWWVADPGLRRRLAQQPSRTPQSGSGRPQVVGI